MKCLSSLEVLQTCSPMASPTCLRAVDFTAQLAQQWGARVLLEPGFPHCENSFSGRGKTTWQPEPGQTPAQWAAAGRNRVLLIANANVDLQDILTEPDISAVEINMESWHGEATLFARSALSESLGDPEREPLVPAAHYAAGSIGYGAFCALSAVFNSIARLDRAEIARVNGLAVMSWISWKAAANGVLAEEMHRKGTNAEWPVLPCKDGYVAFVYGEGNWPGVVDMIGDDRLQDAKFTDFRSRKAHLEECMAIIRAWVATRTRGELYQLFIDHGVPGAPVMSPGELLQDPLFLHRGAFETVPAPERGEARVPVAPHRFAACVAAPAAQSDEKGVGHVSPAGPNLPLAGLRVLDLGIITAGAGTGGLLADMGAEVLKIESETYPDPFRRWAGSSDSPFFKFNNRNKFGVGIDLKTDQGKQQFLKLVETADVVVENFRRGVLDRMGFTLDVLRAVNPSIVLASISGQGLAGPGSHHTTYGSTLEASSGFAALTCYEDHVPHITGINVNYPDQVVCLYAAGSIALAAQQAREHRCAIQIDISQRDVSMYMLGDVLELVSRGTPDNVEAIRRACSDYEIEGVFATADGRYIAISIPDLSIANQHSGLASVKDRNSLAAWAAAQKASDIENQLRSAGCGAATVLVGSEMYALEDIKRQGVFDHTASGVMVKGFPFQLCNSSMTIWGDAPAVGQHSSRFLQAS